MSAWGDLLSFSVSGGADTELYQNDTEREREREIDRKRERETERDRDRDRQTETEILVLSLIQKRIEDKPEKEVQQPAIMMLLRLKYSNRSAQQMIFQKC